MLRRAALLSSIVLLSGCAGQFDHFGKPPTMSTLDPSTQGVPESRVLNMPMPDPDQPIPKEGADKAGLWQSGAKSFFRDQRARRVGDIVTITIVIDDKADMENKTQRSRTNDDKASIPGFFGLETNIPKAINKNANVSDLVDMSSSTATVGDGKINRNEKINLRVAAIIQQKLPNGNFIIAGRQEIRVNFEKRELRVAGVIRPEDINSNNTIEYDKIAEARIAYGGEGQITDIQQPRWGSQVLDVIMPW
jgi:flagellar L-ring protein precursor FlgH